MSLLCSYFFVVISELFAAICVSDYIVLTCQMQHCLSLYCMIIIHVCINACIRFRLMVVEFFGKIINLSEISVTVLSCLW